MNRLQRELQEEKEILNSQETSIKRLQRQAEDTKRRIAHIERQISRLTVERRAPVIDRDRYGNPIRIGDTVDILTAGKWDFRQGIVVKKKAQVIVRSHSKNRYTNRAAFNLEVVEDVQQFDANSDRATIGTSEATRIQSNTKPKQQRK